MSPLLCLSCYKPGATKSCGKCGRRYCSQECQLKDWKEHGHKKWCRRAGEVGKDLDIKDAPGKGFGVFALREFKRGSLVMVETPIYMGSTAMSVHDLKSIPKSVIDIAEPLVPSGGTILQKINKNVISCYADQHGLFRLISRVNHDCIGNVRHDFSEADKVLWLRATRDIAVGEEITFPYIGDNKSPTAHRQGRLKKQYDFDCSCWACTDPAIGERLASMNELDDEVGRRINGGNYTSAIRLGKKLISIYDELNYAPFSYIRTYFDMFQAEMFRSKGRVTEDAKRFAGLAGEFAQLWYEKGNSSRELYEDIAKNPESFMDPSVQMRMPLLGSG